MRKNAAAFVSLLLLTAPARAGEVEFLALQSSTPGAFNYARVSEIQVFLDESATRCGVFMTTGQEIKAFQTCASITSHLEQHGLVTLPERFRLRSAGARLCPQPRHHAERRLPPQPAQRRRLGPGQAGLQRGGQGAVARIGLEQDEEKCIALFRPPPAPNYGNVHDFGSIDPIIISSASARRLAGIRAGRNLPADRRRRATAHSE